MPVFKGWSVQHIHMALEWIYDVLAEYQLVHYYGYVVDYFHTALENHAIEIEDGKKQVYIAAAIGLVVKYYDPFPIMDSDLVYLGDGSFDWETLRNAQLTLLLKQPIRY